MKLKTIRRVIEFTEDPWMKDYIEENTLKSESQH